MKMVCWERGSLVFLRAVFVCRSSSWEVVTMRALLPSK